MGEYLFVRRLGGCDLAGDVVRHVICDVSGELQTGLGSITVRSSALQYHFLVSVSESSPDKAVMSRYMSWKPRMFFETLCAFIIYCLAEESDHVCKRRSHE